MEHIETQYQAMDVRPGDTVKFKVPTTMAGYRVPEYVTIFSVERYGTRHVIFNDNEQLIFGRFSPVTVVVSQ